MLTTESLTQTQWQIAHAIAISLVKDDTDVNELAKAIAYLRATVNQPDAGTKFFKYLKTLVNNGKQIGHSGRTTQYYRSIEQACNQYLQSEQSNAQAMLQILGWAVRLMRYYKEVGISEEVVTPNVESDRKAEIAEVVQVQEFAIGQILDAIVLSVKGNKVTYQILEVIKLTEKEPKRAASLQQGQLVKVKITALKEDGSLKSIRIID